MLCLNQNCSYGIAVRIFLKFLISTTLFIEQTLLSYFDLSSSLNFLYISTEQFVVIIMKKLNNQKWTEIYLIMILYTQM